MSSSKMTTYWNEVSSSEESFLACNAIFSDCSRKYGIFRGAETELVSSLLGKYLLISVQ